MMKPSELMKGDWVMNTQNQQPEQVCEIREHMVMLDYNDLYEYDEFEPIPLTDAILKINGFQYYHKNFASLTPNHPFRLEMVEWPDENGKGGLWVVGGIIKIRYVHELQNALKVCEIDKEIKLED